MLDDVSYDDFEYVVKKLQPAPICFGTGGERKIVVTKFKSITPFGPAHYNVKLETDKIRSKRGIAGIANTAKRVTVDLPNVVSPDPCKYSKMKPIQFKQNCAPFNSNKKRTTMAAANKYPGPGAYKLTTLKLCKRTRFDYNLGRPCVVPAVEMVCLNYPNKWCEKCGEAFEYGDFWHRNYQDYLCTLCMDEEHQLHELYNEKELCVFKKIRTCTFMHRHEGTSAAIRLMPPKKIKKKLQIENYLALYSQCYCTKSQTELVLPLNEGL